MLGDDGEVIAPGAFLPVAGRRGMIRTIDRWVVREAIGLSRAARHSRPPGAQHLAPLALGPDFLLSLEAELRHAQADPADLIGSGFASFHYLMNLPFDELKIDGQFIQNFTSNPDELLLVETLVRLSRGLGKRTVAEFVENPAPLQLIGDVGVDFAQGYYIGRPVPALPLISRAAEVSR